MQKVSEYRVTMHQVDEPETTVAVAETEAKAVIAACEALACPDGPLSRRTTSSFAVLADRVANAFGGEACISLDKL